MNNKIFIIRKKKDMRCLIVYVFFGFQKIRIFEC